MSVVCSPHDLLKYDPSYGQHSHDRFVADDPAGCLPEVWWPLATPYPRPGCATPRLYGIKYISVGAGDKALLEGLRRRKGIVVFIELRVGVVMSLLSTQGRFGAFCAWHVCSSYRSSLRRPLLLVDYSGIFAAIAKREGAPLVEAGGVAVRISMPLEIGDRPHPIHLSNITIAST
jgi:hypothetical protein